MYLNCFKKARYHSKKKTTFYLERDEVKRKLFLEQLSKLSPHEIVYIDESGINRFISREYGWGAIGQKVLGGVSGKRYARESFIAGLLDNKIVAPLCYQGTCDSLLFNLWLKEFLLPSIGPGYTLIMDNAAFHKSGETKEIIENAGCQLLFLPPYSPDLNPIEKCWENLKAIIKKIIGNFKTLADAVDFAFRSFKF